MKISLSAPDISRLEKNLVQEVLAGDRISMGPMLNRFEREFAAYIGSKYAVAVNSGTSGLHLLVRTLGLKDGDEVITTPFSFIASANCLLYEGVKPVFADINYQTMNIDVNLIEGCINPKTKAILPVHVFGRPVQMDVIKEIAGKYHLKIIEDACEAIGAEYMGQKVGTFGDGAVFAFYPNKQITTGEGGMIVTDNDDMAAACCSMRNQGRAEGKPWLYHERLGYNYRLNEMSAALGLGQLNRIKEILRKRSRVAAMYRERLGDIDEIGLPSFYDDNPDIKISWFVFVIRLCPPIDREQVVNHLKNAGIDTGIYFNPIHLQPFYKNQFGYRPGDFPAAEKVAGETLALPFHNNLSEEQVDYVAAVLKEAVAKCRKG